MSSSSADAAAAAWEDWLSLLTQNHNANYAYGSLSRKSSLRVAYPSPATALTFLAYDIVLSFGQEVSGSLLRLSQPSSSNAVMVLGRLNIYGELNGPLWKYCTFWSGIAPSSIWCTFFRSSRCWRFLESDGYLPNRPMVACTSRFADMFWLNEIGPPTDFTQVNYLLSIAVSFKRSLPSYLSCLDVLAGVRSSDINLPILICSVFRCKNYFFWSVMLVRCIPSSWWFSFDNLW
jgi:hypothetical protein